MRRKILLKLMGLVLCTGLVSATHTFAVESDNNTADSLHQFFQESLKAPHDDYKKCCEGTAEVIFVVDDQGKINVKKVVSNDDIFAEKIREQVSKIECKGLKCPFNQHYRIKLTVTLI